MLVTVLLLAVLSWSGAAAPEPATDAWDGERRGAVLGRRAGQRTVAGVTSLLGPALRPRLIAACRARGIGYPPPAMAWVFTKAEKRLHVFAPDPAGAWKPIGRYPVLAASGGAGPKLRRGDFQVPEGRYRLDAFNPNSRFHLSLWINYPNTLDRKMARLDGRTDPGGEIFIHGGAASIGCLAMGDAAIEELFLLAADTGRRRVEVLILPHHWQGEGRGVTWRARPAWLPELYGMLGDRLRALGLVPGGAFGRP